MASGLRRCQAVGFPPLPGSGSIRIRRCGGVTSIGRTTGSATHVTLIVTDSAGTSPACGTTVIPGGAVSTASAGSRPRSLVSRGAGE